MNGLFAGRLFWLRLAFALLFALVTFLTLTPNPDNTEPGFAITRWIANVLFKNPAMTDKIAHFMAYASLGAGIIWAHIYPFGRRWTAPVLLAAYGIVLEGLQGLGGVRSPELADAAANALGALCGSIGAVLLGVLWRVRRRA